MKKILVLEDEANIRSFVVINLRRSGYEPIEAENGSEALEKLKVNPDICLALLDVMLPEPDIDGFEVCRRIRASGFALSEVPGPVDANGKPKRSGIFVSRAQEKARFNGYCDGGPQRRPGLGDMYQAEEQRGHRQSRGKAPFFVNPAEEDAPEYDFFADSDHRCRCIP